MQLVGKLTNCKPLIYYTNTMLTYTQIVLETQSLYNKGIISSVQFREIVLLAATKAANLKVSLHAK